MGRNQLFPSQANPLARSDVCAAQHQHRQAGWLAAPPPRESWEGGQEGAYFRQQQLPECGSQRGRVPRSSMAMGEEEEGRS